MPGPSARGHGPEVITQATKGIVTGFVAGLVVAGGAVLLLRDQATPPAEENAQAADLSAKIDRLERSVSQLSLQERGTSPAAAAGGGTVPAENAPQLTANLPAEERRRIHTRIAAAINNDQIKVQLP